MVYPFTAFARRPLLYCRLVSTSGGRQAAGGALKYPARGLGLLRIAPSIPLGPLIHGTVEFICSYQRLVTGEGADNGRDPRTAYERTKERSSLRRMYTKEEKGG